MAASPQERAKALLTKTLDYLEARFNQKPCETCKAPMLSLKEVELAMTFFKQHGIIFDPAKTTDALDKIPKVLPGEGYPDTKQEPRYTN